MAGLDATFMLIPERRPCFMAGRKALFHKWIVDGRNNTTVGLIELENGSMHKCYLHEVVFCDNEIEQYTFPEKPSENPSNLIPLDELVQKANTGESVYLMCATWGIREWALVRGEGIVETMSGALMHAVTFANGRKFLKRDYGVTWHTYRKKPEK